MIGCESGSHWNSRGREVQGRAATSTTCPCSRSANLVGWSHFCLPKEWVQQSLAQQWLLTTCAPAWRLPQSSVMPIRASYACFEVGLAQSPSALPGKCGPQGLSFCLGGSGHSCVWWWWWTPCCTCVSVHARALMQLFFYGQCQRASPVRPD